MPGSRSPSPLTTRYASRSAGNVAARSAIASSRRRRTSRASTGSSSSVSTRTAIGVRGFAYPAATKRPLAAYTPTGSPGSTPSRPDAIAPEKIHGWPARTGTSRPGLRTIRRTLLAAPDERPGATARLAHEPDRPDRHLAVDRLAHVVEREARDGDRGERLHLDAGARLDRDPRLDRHAPPGAVRGQLDVDVREREGVAERDQVRRPLSGHDARETGNREDVALR